MRSVAQVLAERAESRSEAKDLFAKALDLSSRELGDQDELTAKIRKTAIGCGLGPTTNPTTAASSGM
jgi:hypothetical protein